MKFLYPAECSETHGLAFFPFENKVLVSCILSQGFLFEKLLLFPLLQPHQGESGCDHRVMLHEEGRMLDGLVMVHRFSLFIPEFGSYMYVIYQF